MYRVNCENVALPSNWLKLFHCSLSQYDHHACVHSLHVAISPIHYYGRINELPSSVLGKIDIVWLLSQDSAIFHRCQYQLMEKEAFDFWNGEWRSYINCHIVPPGSNQCRSLIIRIYHLNQKKKKKKKTLTTRYLAVLRLMKVCN